MKKNLFALACILLLAGCAPTVYQKTVTVNMNAKGEVQEIVVVETMTQSLKAHVRTEVDPVYKYLDK